MSFVLFEQNVDQLVGPAGVGHGIEKIEGCRLFLRRPPASLDRNAPLPL